MFPRATADPNTDHIKNLVSKQKDNNEGFNEHTRRVLNNNANYLHRNIDEVVICRPELLHQPQLYDDVLAIPGLRVLVQLLWDEVGEMAGISENSRYSRSRSSARGPSFATGAGAGTAAGKKYEDMMDKVYKVQSLPDIMVS